jgi:uncharacterized protein (TIGR03437 family)
LVVAAVAGAQTPVLRPDAPVVNAASFAAEQVVTPGSLVSIFGTELAAGLAQADSIPLSNTLAGVSVSFNNIPAPILFVAQGQINAQLPWNTLPDAGVAGTADVVVRRGSASSQARQVRIGPFSPAIFSIQFGVGQAIAINLNGLIVAPSGSIAGLVTEPARIGSTIIIYATGLGAVNLPVANGSNSVDALRTNTTTPEVLIGGRNARVEFSGLAPEYVGVNQLNVVVPEGVTPGDAVPLQLRVGGITTTDRVTIAVRAP